MRSPGAGSTVSVAPSQAVGLLCLVTADGILAYRDGPAVYLLPHLEAEYTVKPTESSASVIYYDVF